jgi:hypothetical protein
MTPDSADAHWRSESLMGFLSVLLHFPKGGAYSDRTSDYVSPLWSLGFAAPLKNNQIPGQRWPTVYDGIICPA